MEREELKLVGTKTMQGDFEDILEILDKRPGQVLSKSALYLIVCCCTTCNTHLTENSVDKLNEHKLIKAVIGLTKCIVKVTSEEYDSYLQSIFFICKLLIKKKYELLLQLEAEILPNFIPNELTEKQKSIYRSICGLIQNEIVNITQKKKYDDINKLILIGNLLSKVILQSSNHGIFLEHLVKYGACLQRLNLNLDVQYGFFSSIISATKKLSQEEILNGILHLLKFSITSIDNYLIDGKTLEKAEWCINETLNIIPKDGEWGDLKKILNICKYVIDPCMNKKKLEASKDCLIKSYKLYYRSHNFIIVCKLLSQMLVTFSDFCKHSDDNRLPNQEIHLIIYEILSVATEVLAPRNELCKKGCNCLSKSNIDCSDPALCILVLFSRFLSSDITKEYTRKVENHIKKYLELLVHRKQNNCELYKKWSEAAPYLYNVGVSLLRKERFEEALSFGHMILKYHSLLGESSENIVLPSTYNLLNSLHLKQKNYKDALIWSAIEIINTNKSSRSKMFYKWIKIKAECREENDIQEFSISSILNEILPEFECYISKAKTKEYQIDLLVSELENYYIKWKSKIPMMAAFKHLCQIADKSTIMKVFVQVFTDEDTTVHEEVPKLVKDVFRQFEECQENLDRTLKIYLSFFLFFQYKYQTLELLSKNLAEMDKVVKPKSNADNDVMPGDAFDRCDTVSVYESLKVNGEKLKDLEKAVSLLEEVILSKSREPLPQEIATNKVYDLTRNIAFEFILHSDGYNVLRSLFLGFSIAQTLDKNELLLECCGYLSRYANHSDLEEEMERTANQLKNSEKSYKYLMQYYMNLAYFHVVHKNVKVAYEHYKKAKEYQGHLCGETDKSLWCLEIDMDLLLFKLMEASKVLKFDMDMEFSYGPLMKAYNMVVLKYTTGLLWTSYSMKLLFEVFDSLIKMYFDMRMPREVRCFAKQCLTVAQHHVLPVYASKILSYLAFADLWSERWDDCRVKLEGIADILLLNKTEACMKVSKQTNRLTVPSINDIMEGIKEIMLDAPSELAYDVKSSPASPVLQMQSYRSPFFINHMLCECFHCMSMDCHQVILSYYHLEALFNMHKGQITLADSFFKGVFMLHESLLEKRKDVSVVCHKYVSKHSELFRDLPRKEREINFSLHEIRISSTISYVKFLSSSGAQEAAKKFCDNALKKFKMAKGHHPHLYGELLLQKLGLMCKPEINNETNIVQLVNSSSNESDVKVKTPEASVTNAKLPKINSPRTKKFLPPKVIHFNLTDSTSSVTPSKANSDATAKTPKVRILPPSLRNINTPKLKTAKKSIFNDEQKKSFLSVRCQNITPDHEENQKSPLTELSDIQAINSKNSSTDLEEKTKLLTSRLRKKQISENSTKEKNQIAKEIDNQSVRRSRRNR